VTLERSTLSLVSTIEELLEIKSSGSGLGNRDYGSRVFAALTTRYPLYPHKLTLTSPTSGGRSAGVVGSRPKATELVMCVLWDACGCEFVIHLEILVKYVLSLFATLL
jgi:hypothetical protein